MSIIGQDTLNTRRSLWVGGKSYEYFSIEAAEAAGIGNVARLPKSMKVILENLLRYEDGRSVSVDDVNACAAWVRDGTSTHEIAYRPARVLMQDFTGVPAVVDLAAMRDAMKAGSAVWDASRKPRPPSGTGAVTPGQAVDSSAIVIAPGQRSATTAFIC